MTPPLSQRWRDRRDSYRQRGEGFHPASYRVEPIAPDRDARTFVEQHHYSGSYPAARARVGLYRLRDAWPPRELVGVAVFSVPPSQAVIPKWTALPAAAGIELGRFVLLDEVPFNAESWFLARAIRAMRATLGDAAPSVLLSLSDPTPRTAADGRVITPGHIGTIYQSINGAYLGTTRATLHHLLPSGRILSPRALSKIRAQDQGAAYAERQVVAEGLDPRRPGEEPTAWLARVLPTLRRLPHPGCHVYRWPLAPGVPLPPAPSLPYPKKAPAP